MLIPIPTGVQTTEFTNSIIWLDDSGILYAVPKNDVNAEFSVERLKKEMTKLRSLLGNRKVCLIVEAANRSVTPPKEHRDLIAAEIGSITKAMAIISTSPLSRMVSNLFFSFKPPKYPYKIFPGLKEARDWIRQYM